MTEDESFEEEADIATCEACKEERIEPPALAITQLDGEWLCQYHADKWAQAEGQADHENEQRRDDHD